MTEVKQLVKVDIANNIKKENIVKKRNRRNRSNVDENKAFIIGLKDECPQCGETLGEVTVEETIKHLRECKDTNKHKLYKEWQDKKAEDKLEKEQKEIKQRE